MGISISEIGNIRVPGAYTQISGARATSNLGLVRQRVIIGQKLAAGTMAANTLFDVDSEEQAKVDAGVGSHFADMVKILRQNDTSLRLRGVLLDDNGAGVAAESTITVSGPATASGTLNIYLGGQIIQVGVTNGDSADTIAANIEAAIDADPELLFTATVLTNVVTVICKHKGEWTQELAIAVNPKLTQLDPEGTGFVVASSVTGITNPDITTALDALPDEIFNYILNPYNDTANMDAVETELELRHVATQQLEGFSFNSFAGTKSAALTFGGLRNDRFNTTMHAGNGSLSPEHHWTAAYFAIGSSIAAISPARPWQFRELKGLDPEPEANRLDFADRNDLLFGGVSTHRVERDGTVIIGREITNYQTATGNIPDESFLDPQIALITSDLRETWNSRMITKYLSQGFMLVKDGGSIAPGQNIVNPSIIRGEAISLWQDWADQALVEPGSKEQFKQLLISEIHATDVSRVDVKQSPDLVNQLRIIGNLIEFIR
jgi:phage tail sheath gpL-like